MRFTEERSDSSFATDEGDIDQKRYKLVKLYHAAHCPCESDTTCPKERYCCACKRLFQHMITCTTNCVVPGCKNSRNVWKHYRNCFDEDCPICSAVPTRYSSKALAPRFKQGNRFASSSSQVSTSSTIATDTASTRVLGGRTGQRARPATYNTTGKENPRKIRQAAPVLGQQGRKDIADDASETSFTRPPLSPRTPVWALY